MSGENILHFTGVRMRLVGQGSLQMTMHSLDEVINQTLLPLPMAAATNIQPTRLCNFNQQRAQLEVFTTELNDFFKINRIVIFVKETATSYPG